METMEDATSGDRITTCFAEEEYEECVPFWLEEKLKDSINTCPDVSIWEHEILFEIGVALAPHIGDLATFEIFPALFGASSQEGVRLQRAMEDAAQHYAEWMKHAFFQETSRRRREQERQRLCVLCLAFVRQPGLDVCAACRKDHWQEEQWSSPV